MNTELSTRKTKNNYLTLNLSHCYKFDYDTLKCARFNTFLFYTSIAYTFELESSVYSYYLILQLVCDLNLKLI